MGLSELVQVSKDGNSRTILFRSEHINTVTTARQIASELISIISDEEFETLNVDLSDVPSLGSTALNELISINSNAKQRGVQMVLTNVCDNVQQVLLLTRLERIFAVSPATTIDVAV